MRIAVFSDVHGNLSALQAVLADIAQHAVDEVVFAGDLCALGPRPEACVKSVREASVVSIYGNTDEWVLGRQEPKQTLVDLSKWTLAQLSEADRAWLDALPFEHRISPTARAGDDLLIVHANPVDVNQLIFPPEDEQKRRYGRVRQSDGDLAELLAGTRCAALVFGHLHIPYIRTWKQLRLFNISSVSVPGDGDPRAKYGLFTWDGMSWSFERRRVEYDVQAEIDAYRQRRPPRWLEIVETIEKEGYFPQNV